MFGLDNDGFHPMPQLIATCQCSSEQEKAVLGRVHLGFGDLGLDIQGTQRRTTSCCFELDLQPSNS